MATKTETTRSFELNADGARTLLSAYRDPQAWKRVAFLFLAFPTGILYFVALVTGVSLGAGMAVTLVGFPLLALVFYAAGWATQFEAWLTNRMLDADVKPIVYHYDEETALGRFGAALKDVRRWKGIAWLFLRFPMGIVAFVAVTFLMSLPAGMMTAPFTYNVGDGLSFFFWTVDSFGEAIILSALGVFVGAVSLHIVAGITGIWAGIAEALLADTTPATKTKNDEKTKRELDTVAA